MARYKGDPEDLIEFGSDEEVGAPCPGTLIKSIPDVDVCVNPDEEIQIWYNTRVAYRQQRREYVHNMCIILGLEPCTYREYMMGLGRKKSS